MTTAPGDRSTWDTKNQVGSANQSTTSNSDWGTNNNTSSGGIDTSNSNIIDVTPATNNTESSSHSVPPPKEASSSALTTTKGTFSAFLAPLTQDTFKQVVSDVEEKLKVVNQTLSMLDNVLGNQGFDEILQEMLRSITLKTGELLGADRTTIWLLDDDRDELWSIVAKGENGKPLELRIPADKGISGEVATFKKTVNIPYDFYDDPRSEAAKGFDKKNHYRTYTMLTLPLLNDNGDLVAVVQLINKIKKLDDPNQVPLSERVDVQGFTEEDEKLFEEFAPSIRLILESSRSFYKAIQRQRAAEALMAAIQSLSKSSLDLEETLKKVMEEARKLMNAARSTLWLVDEEKYELWTKIELDDGTPKELRIPRNAGFAGQVAESGEPLIIPFDLYDHPGSQTAKKTDQETGFRTCSLLCMPVFNADNQLIGVTQLVNKIKTGDHPPYNPEDWPQAPERWKASFNKSDLEFMKAFNIQAGVALQNAKLFATVKQQEQMQRDILRSLTDGVISTDHDGDVIAANESAKQLLGFEESDRIDGLSISELLKIQEGDFANWLAAALHPQDDKSRQQYYPEQTLLAHNSKAQHSINLSINSIADASDPDNVYGALVVMEDISDEKRLKTTLYRYMTQDVAETLLSSGELKLGGERREVSVLFSDIRSYTTLTEGMQAEEVVDMLNEYFESMVDAVLAKKGTLDKYIGDSIMAVFGSPVPFDDHEWMAVQTAVEMRHRLVRFNEKQKENGKQPIRMGIGIHSDEVISGNIGSSKRMELTSIGDGVNLASRLEGASKHYGCDIIISDKTYQSCADRIYVRELDYITVKGRHEPVKIYEVVGLRSETLSDETTRLVDAYQRGREFYLNRQFARAMSEFGTVLEIDKSNKAAQLHLQRCQHFLQEPPSEDWDGVWRLTEK